ncbi:MAG: DUF4215 domain-containing protein, partial [Promethearchaeia archaeon]
MEAGWGCSGGWCVTGTCSPICGDGAILGGEECDDGNGGNHDGCSASCSVECGWSCSGTDGCTGICGDGMRKGGEECDDGNTEGDDGCSSSCAIEAGFTCSGARAYWQCGGAGDSCRLGCGIGVMEEGSSKECDDGNLVAGDGCSPGCRVECGFRCFGGNLTSASVCAAAACGDKTLGGQEECDDGNVEDGDGCSSDCMIEEGYSCLHYAVPPY